MVVVFPAPFGPRKPCTSPVWTVSRRWSSALVVPEVLHQPGGHDGVGVVGVRRDHRVHASTLTHQTPGAQGRRTRASVGDRHPPGGACVRSAS